MFFLVERAVHRIYLQGKVLELIEQARELKQPASARSTFPSSNLHGAYMAVHCRHCVISKIAETVAFGLAARGPLAHFACTPTAIADSLQIIAKSEVVAKIVDLEVCKGQADAEPPACTHRVHGSRTVALCHWILRRAEDRYVSGVSVWWWVSDIAEKRPFGS
ncbi:MAG: hypothetical protein AB7K24_21260 [Gemmataceae bacterium]